MGEYETRTREELEDINYNYWKACNLTEEDYLIFSKGHPSSAEMEAFGGKVKSFISNQAKFENKENPAWTRLYRTLKNDIIETIVNDAILDPNIGYLPGRGGRKAEYDRYRKLREKQINEALVLLCKRGFIRKSEMDSIAKNFKTESRTVESLVAQEFRNTKVIDDSSDNKAKIEIQKFAKADQNCELATQKKAHNLFEFFGFSDRDSLATIKGRVEEYDSRDAQLQKQKGKEALKNVYTDAKEILLKDELIRKRYILFERVKDDVYSDLKVRSDSSVRTLTINEYLSFADVVGKKGGCSNEEAEQFLNILVNALGFNVEENLSSGDGTKTWRCPNPECGKLFILEEGLTACPHCGKSFFTVCGNCQNKYKSKGANANCPKCGFTVKMQESFNSEAGRVREALKNPRITVDEAKRIVNGLKNSFAAYDKVPASESCKTVAFFDEMISSIEKADRQKFEQFKNLAAEVDKFISGRKYFSAQAKVREISAVLPGYNLNAIQTYNSEIDQKIRRSEEFLETARRNQSAGNENGMISNAIKALEICSDNANAIKILEKYPPEAPKNVRSKLSDGKVIIEWDYPQNSGVLFTVIKKTGSVPQNPSDGAVVANNIALSYFEDSSVSAGNAYYYAVYGERFGVKTSIAANREPILVLPDISNASQDLTEGIISVKWNTPSNVAGIVVKKVKGAFDAKNGEEFRNAGREGLSDSDCDKNGCSYFVQCKYNINGKIQLSKGVELFFKPLSMPKLLGKIDLSVAYDRTVTVKASNICDTALVYLSPIRIPVSSSKPEKVELIGSLLKGSEKVNSYYDSDRNLVFRTPAGFTGFAYVLNVVDSLFTISEPCFLTTVSGITIISAEEKNQRLTIKCNVTGDITNVVAKVSNKAFPESKNDDGQIFSFSAESVKRDGQIILNLQENSISYVSLFPEVRRGSDSAYGAAVKLDRGIDSRKKNIVKFALVYDANPAKSFTVTVKFEADTEEDLSKCLFVINKGSPKPLNRNAGTKAASFTGPSLKKGLMTHGKYVGKVSVQLPPMAKFLKLSMFFSDDGEAPVTLRESMGL